MKCGVSYTLEVGAKRHRLQIIAVIKGIIVDLSDAAGDHDAFQTGAFRKRIGSDVSYIL